MSKFTTEVRFICETYAGYDHSVGYDKINDVVRDSHEKVIGDYPIFDEDYREVLDTKILKHYYTREICEETVGLWKLRLNTRMNEIMPYYNKMYESELIKFNPMYDIDLNKSQARNTDTNGDLTSTNNEVNDETRNNESSVSENNVNTRTGEQLSSGNRNVKREEHSGVNEVDESEKENKSTDRYSDTPQGGLGGMENLEENMYLTNARIIDGTEETKGKRNQQSDTLGTGTTNEVNSRSDNEKTVDSRTGSNSMNETTKGVHSGSRNEKNKINTTEDYLEHLEGKRGGRSYSSLLVEYRESFINIDKMVIDELADLFFGLWE